MLNWNYGEKLLKLRKSKKWTQSEAAEKIGIGLRFYQKLEYGESEPGFKTIEKIHEAFGLTPLMSESEMVKQPIEQVLLEFGRLLSRANPLAIKHALQILEVGQPNAEASHVRRRTAKTSTS